MAGKKKVGILTFQESLNYGAALQCYSLFEALRNLQCMPVVINYRNPLIASNEGIIIGARPKVAAIALMRNRSRKIRAFSDFLRAETNLTPPCDRKAIHDTCSALDCVITGSDQVWNVNLTDNDSTYFLDFLAGPDQRKSYAASIGYSELPESFDYAAALSGFSSLLLREETGARLVKSILPDSNPQVVLDPTLLLSHEAWGQIGRECRSAGRRFVVCYTVSERQKTLQVAQRLGNHYSAPVVHVHPTFLDWRRTEGAKNLWDASPYEFVWLFQNASASVVSSFHGVCFSILNHLNFYYATDVGASAKASRIIDLLDLLGIKGRSVDDYLAGTQIPIDWESVDIRLEELREDSLLNLAASLDIER